MIFVMAETIMIQSHRDLFIDLYDRSSVSMSCRSFCSALEIHAFLKSSYCDNQMIESHAVKKLFPRMPDRREAGAEIRSSAKQQVNFPYVVFGCP